MYLPRKEKHDQRYDRWLIWYFKVYEGNLHRKKELLEA